MIDLRQCPIGIVGLGQIGGSLASALRQALPEQNILAFDVDSGLAEQASSHHLITGAAANIADLLQRADVVIIALPIQGICDLLADHGEQLRGKRLIADVGSLKSKIIETAQSLRLANFVGGHPLAGSERRGAGSWNPHLFERANYFVCAPPGCNPDAIGLHQQFVTAIGGVEIAIDPQIHDQIFATSSNIPHLLAFLLRAQFADATIEHRETAAFACPSYRSATRVAASDPEMVYQMLWHNRKNLTAALRRFRDDLNAAQKALDNGDALRFRQIFAKGDDR